MKEATLLIYILVMAVVTYAIRMLPLALFNRKIESKFVRSFLYYIPYAVLGTMTFPAIFYSTGNSYSAIAGLLVAVLLAMKGKGLVTVAMCACVAVLVVESVMGILI
ncbi:MAG: AzlD domain-containing protein [Eubacterium sp.]